MRRTLLAVLAAVLGASVVASTASADQAPLPGDDRGNVQIIQLRYNVRGVDTSANAKYEWIALRNLGLSAVDIDGWTIEDATGNAYELLGDSAWDVPGTPVIELDPILKPGQTVVVHTGRDTVPSADVAGAVNLYWGRWHHVWANSGKDAATVYNAAGARVDRLAYDDFTVTP